MSDERTVDAFVLYQKSVASRLRYQQAISNMEAMHALGTPCRVLDAAGGNGLVTEYFLRAGHRVTLMDADPAMLEQARERLGAAGLLENVTFVEGTLEQAGAVCPAAAFGLILCHHVLEYTSDVPAILEGLRRLAAPGCELSLITLNPVSEVMRAVLFGHDPALAESKLTDLRYDARWFGQATLYPKQQIVDWAARAGWSLGDLRAIRVLADYMPDADIDEAKEQALLALEEKLAALDPYRHAGRYLQFCFKA